MGSLSAFPGRVEPTGERSPTLGRSDGEDGHRPCVVCGSPDNDYDLLGLAHLYAQSSVCPFVLTPPTMKFNGLLISWYTEDGRRIPACKPLVKLGQVLGNELVCQSLLSISRPPLTIF